MYESQKRPTLKQTRALFPFDVATLATQEAARIAAEIYIKEVK